MSLWILVCSSSVTAVCDTGASVSCITQRLLKRFPVNFQNQLQLAHCRLLATNQAEKRVSDTVTLPISFGSSRYQQQFFELKSAETDCLLGLDFLEDNPCDALFSSTQRRFPNSQTIPLFNNGYAPSDPSLEHVKVIARKTISIPADHEALILGKLLTQSFSKKYECAFGSSPAFGRKYQLLAFSSRCESGETRPACLINLVEDVTVYRGTSLWTFPWLVGSAEKTALTGVIADLSDHPQGQLPDEYDVMELLKQTQSSMHPQIRAQFAQLFRTFSDVFSKPDWDFAKCDLVQHKIDLYLGSKSVKLPNRRMSLHFKKDLHQKIQI